MATARRALSPDLGQQASVHLGNARVVVENGQPVQESADIGFASGAVALRGQFHSELKFGHGDRGDGDIIVGLE